jgi:N-acetylmuramoyl-L-alanine amidase
LTPELKTLSINISTTKMARKIKKIFVHCTASRQSWSVDALLKEFRDKGWHYPGYHWVVTADGKRTQLMTEDLPSNGVKGHNFDSVNVAYMGGISRTGKAIDNRTEEQKAGLRQLLKELRQRYPDAKIMGHRDISPDKNHNGVVDPWERIKECPCFDAIPEYADI